MSREIPRGSVIDPDWFYRDPKPARFPWHGFYLGWCALGWLIILAHMLGIGD